MIDDNRTVGNNTVVTTIPITAPMYLSRGFKLEVEIDGKKAYVVVPHDVHPGDTFEATAKYDRVPPVSPGFQPPMETTPSKKHIKNPYPDGDFKFGLFDCTADTILCKAQWWLSFFCSCIPFAQLLNRFRWNAWASRTEYTSETAFAVIIGVTTFAYCLLVILFSTTTFIAPLVIWILFLIGVNVVFVRARMNFRNHYKIKGDGFMDCCVMYWCFGCSVVQMLRQTHNEKEYPYDASNILTGLPQNAPEIV